MSASPNRRALVIALVILNGLAVLLVVNGLILKKQQIVEKGRLVYLELAPVDPRSLMQGDYMALNYALSRDRKFVSDGRAAPTRGRVILKLDKKGKATYSHFEPGDDEKEAAPLKENEIYFAYRKWRRGWRFGIESFFFQEGLAKTYEQAKFAELRVSEDGVPVLVDLRGEDLESLPMPDEIEPTD